MVLKQRQDAMRRRLRRQAEMKQRQQRKEEMERRAQGKLLRPLAPEPIRNTRESYTGGVMTFTEIGESLGITRGGAFMLYRSALSKLRRHPQALSLLQQMADELEKNRDRSEERIGA